MIQFFSARRHRPFGYHNKTNQASEKSMRILDVWRPNNRSTDSRNRAVRLSAGMMPAKSRTNGMLAVCPAVAASIGPASADWVTATVTVGTQPECVAINPVTNRIYVADAASNDVTVVDCATNGTTTVPTGATPRAVAVNPVTNRVYVANSVRAPAPGVHFVRKAKVQAQAQASVRS